jgi:hypothetical protein
MSAEQKRLEEARSRVAHWKRWGPYFAERAWGTVREDYSPDGAAWDYFPHDHARSRAYRWNEDGLGGFCDRHQRICFALALWNERDPILKERLFGLSGAEGNHGEDVKECYWYLDSTPTHSFMRFLYRYPQAAFPYEELVAENRRRGRGEPEYELIDTGVFEEDRYFDVLVEYAKAGVEELLVRITAINRGPEPAPLHLLPTLWFRNTWSWDPHAPRPILRPGDSAGDGWRTLATNHSHYGERRLYCEGAPELLFTENETNTERLFGVANTSAHVKDAFHEYVVHGREEAVNPARFGSKAAAHYRLLLAPGERREVRLRFAPGGAASEADPFGREFEATFAGRRIEADEFYAEIIPNHLSADGRSVMRQALAGLLWSKQYYHYVVRQWLEGDPGQPSPPEQRLTGRNCAWAHLYNADVLSMPDKWEYPWYASWDLAFHCLPLALVDSDFAKEQLVLLLREWYLHPNGQLPAYEWSFSDANPPVHAWAAWRVFKIEGRRRGREDRRFLERVFQKLMLNFTWWVNRKDADGRNLFQGGFLGLDNIGIFDRSAPLPTGGRLEQADGTSWMGMFCLNMLAMAMDLARHNVAYEDVASKFWEHFVYIAHALNNLGRDDLAMWDEADGFYYDVLRLPDGTNVPLKIRSMVGLIPLFAVETLEADLLERLPAFTRRMEWFLHHRQDLLSNMACMQTPGQNGRRLLAVVSPERLRRVLKVMLDEREFLSPYGVRALSAYHREHPYRLEADGAVYQVAYEPAESTTDLFGGNSNWRGPVWFPVNYLLIESLQKFHFYLGDDFRVECPTGSGIMLNLWEVSVELSRRLTRLFLQDAEGRRPIYGDSELLQSDPHWRELLLFHEYFHGDTGEGLGASHQTGWTGLVAKLLQQSGEGKG